MSEPSPVPTSAGRERAAKKRLPLYLLRLYASPSAPRLRRSETGSSPPYRPSHSAPERRRRSLWGAASDWSPAPAGGGERGGLLSDGGARGRGGARLPAAGGPSPNRWTEAAPNGWRGRGACAGAAFAAGFAAPGASGGVTGWLASGAAARLGPRRRPARRTPAPLPGRLRPAGLPGTPGSGLRRRLGGRQAGRQAGPRPEDEAAGDRAAGQGPHGQLLRSRAGKAGPAGKMGASPVARNIF